MTQPSNINEWSAAIALVIHALTIAVCQIIKAWKNPSNTVITTTPAPVVRPPTPQVQATPQVQSTPKVTP